MRLDKYLTEKGLVKSRSQGQDIIKRGFVKVNDQVVLKTGYDIKEDDLIAVEKEVFYVSRGAEKILHAIHMFDIDLSEKTVVDVGASTGGFTQVCLSQGASKVYAYDVGKNQLDNQLRVDKRIISFEETNILDVKLPPHDMCVIDVSFTSIIPILTHVMQFSNEIVFLLKPQYETDGKHLKKGVIKSEKTQQQVIEKTIQAINNIKFKLIGFTPSPITGKDGNKEYLFYITRGLSAC